MDYGQLRKEVIFLFERCRGIPALEVARSEGMALIPRGRRHWALCPLHGEKTPSLMFDEKGRWHCFSCQQGGDAVALLAALRGIRPLEAARILASGRKAPPPDRMAPRRAQALALKNRVEAWYKRAWDEACLEREIAQQLCRCLPPSSPRFYAAIARRSQADLRLDSLQGMSLKDCLEAAHKAQTQNRKEQRIDPANG